MLATTLDICYAALYDNCNQKYQENSITIDKFTGWKAKQTITHYKKHAAVGYIKFYCGKTMFF